MITHWTLLAMFADGGRCAYVHYTGDDKADDYGFNGGRIQHAIYNLTLTRTVALALARQHNEAHAKDRPRTTYVAIPATNYCAD